jgi:hypothetical protein
MPSPPFEKILPQKPNGFIGKLFGQKKGFEAFTEFNNLLSEAATFDTIPINLLSKVNAKYEVDVRKRYSEEMRTLYKKGLEFLASDETLTQQEISDLYHLREGRQEK